MFSEGLTREGRWREELEVAAYSLDVDRFDRALGQYQKGWEKGRGFDLDAFQSASRRAIRSSLASLSAKLEDCRYIVSSLLQARSQVTDEPVSENLFKDALECGDKPILETILPLCKNGIDTAVPQAGRPVMFALEYLDRQDFRMKGRLSNWGLFEWVMSKSPNLEVPESIRFTHAMEPLPFALARYADTSRTTPSRRDYGLAVSALVKAKAPLWIEGERQSWAAAQAVVASDKPAWHDYLMSQLPAQHWDELEDRLKKESLKAKFRQMRMDAALKAPQAPPPFAPKQRF